VGVSIKGLIDVLQRTMNMAAEVSYQPARGLDVPAIVLDCSAAWDVFGWRAQTRLESGIRDHEAWYVAEYQRRVA